eukprot:1635386-Rhodomonas_salina.1
MSGSFARKYPVKSCRRPDTYAAAARCGERAAIRPSCARFRARRCCVSWFEDKSCAEGRGRSEWCRKPVSSSAARETEH